MKKTLTAAILATVALGGTAFAESTVDQQRDKLNALWGKNTTPAVSAQVSATRDGVKDRLLGGTQKGSYAKTRSFGFTERNVSGR